MRDRRSIAEFRDAGYRAPKISWLFNQVWLYILIALAGVAALGQLVYSTVTAADAIRHPAKPPTQYQNIKLATSSAVAWAKSFTSQAPPGEKDWNGPKTITPAQPISFKDCQNVGLPPTSLLATAVGQNDDLTTTAQVYGPGLGPSAFQQYKKLYSSCWTTSSEKIGDEPTEVVSYSKGFFFSYGDAVIFVESDNKSNEDLKKYYVNKAAQSLKQSHCATLMPAADDIKRNLFNDAKNYTGLIAKNNIITKVKFDNVPTPIYPSIAEPTQATQPEAPLPASFKQEPKATVQKPTIPQDPVFTKPQTEKMVTYQVDDIIGPGCGWVWSGSTAPVVDNAELTRNKNKIVNDAQTLVDGNATKYLNDKLNYARYLLGIMGEIGDWNSYVQEVNDVHQKWQWLDDQRSQLQTPWYNYVNAHNDWVDFDIKKANAIKDYNDQINTCNAKNQAVQDWEDQWGAAYQQQQQQQNNPSTPSSSSSVPAPSSTATPTPSSTSTPSPSSSPSSSSSSSSTVTMSSPATSSGGIPQKPEGCSDVPAIPAIAQQNKGQEPQPPTIPKDVTIPNSWPQPIKNPDIQKK